MDPSLKIPQAWGFEVWIQALMPVGMSSLAKSPLKLIESRMTAQCGHDGLDATN